MRRWVRMLKTGYGPTTLMYRLDDQAGEVQAMAREGRISKRSARRVEKLLRKAVVVLLEEHEATKTQA